MEYGDINYFISIYDSFKGYKSFPFWDLVFYLQILETVFIIAYNCYLIIKSYERRNCLC